MKKMVNSIKLAGRVYEHSLAVKTVQNKDSANFGKEFIGGKLDIVTDDEGLNVITVNFTYVTPTTKSGTANATYNALKTIIDSGKCVVTDGMDAATKVTVDTSLGLNDFYTNRNGEETLVSAKQCDGGFVHIVSSLPEERNKFTVDMLMNGVRRVEANEERNLPERFYVKGAVFNFRGAFMPVEFIVTNPAGVDYFDSLDLSSSNMVLTKVEGHIVSQTINEEIEEESAWGTPSVRIRQHNVRDWVLDRSANPYEFGDESVMTVEDVKKCLEDRNVYLADVKRRADEYAATKATAPAAASVGTTAATGSFDF